MAGEPTAGVSALSSGRGEGSAILLTNRAPVEVNNHAPELVKVLRQLVLLSPIAEPSVSPPALVEQHATDCKPDSPPTRRTTAR